ncbi:MAG: transposase, partial [Proteobacteria bacterium]|nr:transposase [Pseudomonadota bacterium]
KFTDALKGLSPSRRKKALASYAVAVIDQLFKIEREAGHNPEMRLKLRKERSDKLIQDLKCWLDENITSVQKKSLTGKAMFYLKNQWEPLTGFLTCGLVPISNNYVENLIRPVAVGRKAWLCVS